MLPFASVQPFASKNHLGESSYAKLWIWNLHGLGFEMAYCNAQNLKSVFLGPEIPEKARLASCLQQQVRAWHGKLTALSGNDINTTTSCPRAAPALTLEYKYLTPTAYDTFTRPAEVGSSCRYVPHKEGNQRRANSLEIGSEHA